MVFESSSNQPRQPLRPNSNYPLSKAENPTFEKIKKRTSGSRIDSLLFDEVDTVHKPKSNESSQDIIEYVDEPQSHNQKIKLTTHSVLGQHRPAMRAQKKTKSYDIDALELDYSQNSTKESISSINSDFFNEPVRVTDSRRSLSATSHDIMDNDFRKKVSQSRPAQCDIDEILDESVARSKPSSSGKLKTASTNLNIIDELLENGDSIDYVDVNRNRTTRHNDEQVNLKIDEYNENESSTGFKLTIHKVIGRRSGTVSKNTINHCDLDELWTEEETVDVGQPQLVATTGRKRLKIESLFEDDNSPENSNDVQTPEDILSLSTNSLSLDDDANDQTIRRIAGKSVATDVVDFEPSTHNWLTNYDMTGLKDPGKPKGETPVGAARRTGSEWLREASEKLNQTVNLNQTSCLNETSSNETILTTGRKTSPTMLTVNTSTLFLNDGDIRKRKVKFTKFDIFSNNFFFHNIITVIFDIILV
jgi:hypothetical protein